MSAPSRFNPNTQRFEAVGGGRDPYERVHGAMAIPRPGMRVAPPEPTDVAGLHAAFWDEAAWPPDTLRLWSRPRHPSNVERLKLLMFLIGNGYPPRQAVDDIIHKWPDLDASAVRQMNWIITALADPFARANDVRLRYYFYYDIADQQWCYIWNGAPRQAHAPLH